MDNSIEQVNSIFEQPWWLDAVAPGRWDTAEIEKGGKLVARLPYFKTKRLGFNLLGMPDYTQTLGYWIEKTGSKNAKKYAREKDLISGLIKQLPQGYAIDIAFDHTCDYLFPFKWSGFMLHMMYSYRIEDIHDIDQLWNGLSENIKTDIKKAQKILHIEDDHPIDDLILMQEKTFGRQGRNLNDKSDLIIRIDAATTIHQARKFLCAVDAEGRIHAAAYFVFDSKCCYYLIGGSDPELRNSGASSLLVWEGLKYASTVSKSFDFEGSMIEPIERFFRGFGGVPTPYWRVTKMNTILNLADYLKPKVKKLLGYK